MPGFPGRNVGPQQIWSALVNSGASSVQAAAIMGNAFYESSLNPESHAMDSNGHMAYGLVSWNTASYPSAATLVTGDPLADLQAQVKFLGQTGGLKAASGSTVREAASNFAAKYEVCQGCNPGGQQNQMRVAKAMAFLAASKSGRWPQSGGSSPGGGETGSSADCLAQMPAIDLKITSVGGGCLLSKSEGRLITGVAVMTAGGVIMALGVLLLAAYGLKSSPVGKALEQAGTGIALIPGAAVAGAAVSDAGRVAQQKTPPRKAPRPRTTKEAPEGTPRPE